MLGKIFVVKTFNSLNQRMQDEMNRRQGNGPQRPEGSITIDPGVKKEEERRKGNDDGDFVDFEEIK